MSFRHWTSGPRFKAFWEMVLCIQIGSEPSRFISLSKRKIFISRGKNPHSLRQTCLKAVGPFGHSVALLEQRHDEFTVRILGPRGDFPTKINKRCARREHQGGGVWDSAEPRVCGMVLRSRPAARFTNQSCEPLPGADGPEHTRGWCVSGN